MGPAIQLRIAGPVPFLRPAYTRRMSTQQQPGTPDHQQLTSFPQQGGFQQQGFQQPTQQQGQIPQQQAHQPQQAYAQYSPQQHGYYAPASAGSSPVAPAPQRLNVMGLVALAIMLVESLLALVWPFVYRIAMDNSSNFSTVSVISSISHWALVIPAIILGVVGVLQKQAPRARWAAFAALGAAGTAAISMLGSLLGNFLAYAF